MDCNNSRPGAYFMTIVTNGRKSSFGEVAGGEMRLNEFGRLAENEWKRLRRRFDRLVMDELVVMPNHVHGIVIIRDNEGRGGSVSGKGFMPIETTSGMHYLAKIGSDPPLRGNAPRSAGNHPCVQIILCTANQPPAPYPRCTGLAAQLLRAHHPG